VKCLKRKKLHGEDMKQYVMKFKKENDLIINHYVDYEFYKKLGIALVD